MKAPLPPFLVEEYLDTFEDVQSYLEDAFQTKDISYLRHALGIALRSANAISEAPKEII